MSTNAQIIVSMRNQADPEVRKLAASFRDLIQRLRDTGATQEQAERKALSHAQALAQLAVKSGQAAQGERILAAALSQVERSSTAAVRAETQLVNVQNKLSQSWGAQALNDFKQGLSSFVAPAAAATVALGVLRSAAEDVKSAFLFKAQLDATARSIAIQLSGVRDSSQVFRQAAVFGDRYKLTQEEINQALIASVGILRQSRAGADELLGVLARLQIASPEQPLEGAALAVKELQSGQINSLVTRFEVSRDAANRMKAEIEGGADAVLVLSKYLSNAGIGMEALEARTTGAMGKLNEFRQAEEQRRLALAGQAGGLGEVLLELNTAFTRGQARLFGADGGLAEGIRQLEAQSEGGRAAQEAYNRALAEGKSETEALAIGQRVGAQVASDYAYGFQQTTQGLFQSAAAAAQMRAQAEGLASVNAEVAAASKQATQDLTDLQSQIQQSAQQSVLDAAAKRTQQIETAKLQKETQAAVNSLLKLNPNIDQAGLSSLLASDQIKPLVYQLAVLQLQAAETSNQMTLLANLGGLSDALPKALERTARAGKDVKGALSGFGAGSALDTTRAMTDANRRLAIARGGPAEALRIARAELAKLRVGTVEYLNKQAEVVSLAQQVAAQQNSAGKTRVKDARDALNLEESILDAQERQARSALDARLAALDDRKQRRIEERELAAARRVLASGSTSADQKAAAADVLERIPLEQQRRALDIAGKSRDAGGTIIGGKLFGSVPGGGQPGQPGSGALPQLPTVPGAAPAGGQPGIEVLVMLDGQQIAANVTTRLRGGFNGARAGGAGGG